MIERGQRDGKFAAEMHGAPADASKSMLMVACSGRSAIGARELVARVLAHGDHLAPAPASGRAAR